MTKEEFHTNIEDRSIDAFLDHHHLDSAIEKKHEAEKIEKKSSSRLRTLLASSGSLKKMWIMHEIFRSPYLDQ